MKITGFRPLIVSPNAEEVIALFEALGFERNHKKEGINDSLTAVSLKDPNGFRVLVSNTNNLPRDLTAVAMNVDDFEEAYEFLIARGFKNSQGDKFTETGSSKDTLMISPSGFGICLSHHIKKEDR